MKRPSREQCLIETAFIWARRSTCSRLQVGCVIHRDGRILALGYNGAPAGMPHCNHECNCLEFHHTAPAGPVDHWSDCRSETPCTTAEHAERNAIAFAARYGVGLEGAAIVVTHEPCAACAMSVVNAGIREVTYVHPYRLHDGVELLWNAGLKVNGGIDPEMKL